MCFDLDSRPPIPRIAGAAVDHQATTLTAADGNTFRAFHATPASATGNAILILPDVRGLHPYYEELALRFAESGVEALALDYFGRTAGTAERPGDFDHMAHVGQTSWEGLQADIRGGIEFLRREDGSGPRSIFTIGFCMGGRLAMDAASLGLDLAGVIGFYGWPIGPHKAGTPAPAEIAASLRSPVLAIFGGADRGIPGGAVDEFRHALEAAGIEHEVAVEPDAPHGFFDQKQAEYQAQSDDAWARVRRFVDRHGAR